MPPDVGHGCALPLPRLRKNSGLCPGLGFALAWDVENQPLRGQSPKGLFERLTVRQSQAEPYRTSAGEAVFTVNNAAQHSSFTSRFAESPLRLISVTLNEEPQPERPRLTAKHRTLGGLDGFE